ncbi:MAG: hypothetical protein PHU85_12735, partial [Phycisphaerae bacterium]|nr:hypothetical protein [Phycisphaerae bacterium]
MFVQTQTVSYPAGAVLEYAYSGAVNSGLGRPSGVAGGGTTFVAYSYLGRSTIVSVSHPAVAGGLTLDYGATGSAGLDRLGRVVDQKWTVAGNAADEFRYGYDAAGNRQFRENTAGRSAGQTLDEWYTYDGLGRLTHSSRGSLGGGAGFPDYAGIVAPAGGSQSWSLDQLGNWGSFGNDTSGNGAIEAGETQAREANAANEITSITGPGAATPQYDAAGNMTFDGTRHYEYDAWNHLVAAYADDTSGGGHHAGGLIARYAYDPRGYRTAKIVARRDDAEAPEEITGYDRTDYYYNDNWQVLEERLATNVSDPQSPAPDPYVQYLWDQRYVDALVCRWRDTTGDGVIDETLYYAQDANWNVTALVNPAGQVVERYVYSPYGERTVLNGEVDAAGADTSASQWQSRASNTFGNEIANSGYRLDPETGNNQVRNVYFRPPLGVSLSRDPNGYGDGNNLGDMINSDPINGTDPMGLDVFEDQVQALCDEYGSAIDNLLSRARGGEFAPSVIADVANFRRGSGWIFARFSNSVIANDVAPDAANEAMARLSAKFAWVIPIKEQNDTQNAAEELARITLADIQGELGLHIAEAVAKEHVKQLLASVEARLNDERDAQEERNILSRKWHQEFTIDPLSQQLRALKWVRSAINTGQTVGGLFSKTELSWASDKKLNADQALDANLEMIATALSNVPGEVTDPAPYVKRAGARPSPRMIYRLAQAVFGGAKVVTQIGRAGRNLWAIRRVTGIMRAGPWKFLQDPKTALWWTRDIAGHGGSAWKIYKETAKGLEWLRDADIYGTFMVNKT